MLSTRSIAVAIAAITALSASPAPARHVVPQHPRHAVDLPFSVEEFLHKDNLPYFLREPIEQSLTADDLPYLYRVLADTQRHTQWDNALLALCVLEEGPRALEAVIGKVTGPWHWTEHVYTGSESRSLLKTRIGYLWNISMIDPKLAGPFLADLLSPEGATAFLESWGALPLPVEDQHGHDDLVNDVQRAAAYALVYTRSPDQITHVTSEFHRQARMTDERGFWRNSGTVFRLAEALALYDLLEEKGWKEGMQELRESRSNLLGGITWPQLTQRIAEADAIARAEPGVRWKRVVVRHRETWSVALVFALTTITGALIVWLVRRKRLVKLQSRNPAADT